MKKDELLALLKKGLNAEEKSIPIYTKHFGSSIFWTGIEEAKAETARKLLISLATGSSTHKEIVKNLITIVEASGKNIF